MYSDLLDLVREGDDKMPYVMTGKVVGNDNQEKPMSVQVTIPERTTDMNVTAWARVAMPLVGNGFGAYSLPEIGDEVVLVFCNGEIDTPLVIGCLYNQQNIPPEEAKSEENKIKCIKTAEGHLIRLDGTDKKTKIELVSAGGAKITLEDENDTLSIQDAKAKNSVIINGKDEAVSVTASASIRIKAGGCEISLDDKGQSISVKGPKVSIEGTQELSLKAPQIKIKGQMVKLEADTQIDVKSSGTTNVKGSMVKIN